MDRSELIETVVLWAVLLLIAMVVLFGIVRLFVIDDAADRCIEECRRAGQVCSGVERIDHTTVMRCRRP